MRQIRVPLRRQIRRQRRHTPALRNMPGQACRKRFRRRTRRLGPRDHRRVVRQHRHRPMRHLTQKTRHPQRAALAQRQLRLPALMAELGEFLRPVPKREVRPEAPACERHMQHRTRRHRHARSIARQEQQRPPRIARRLDPGLHRRRRAERGQGAAGTPPPAGHPPRGPATTSPAISSSKPAARSAKGSASTNPSDGPRSRKRPSAANARA